MKRIVCTLLFVLILLLMAEYILRAAFPYKLRHINYTGEMAYEFDEDYLLRLKKNIHKSFYRTKWNGGTKINWRTNSLGFRGEELEQHSSQRIVVYGDSNIHARFSALENTYPEQLRHFLQQAGKETEVINAGVVGMGPDQLLLKFQKEIPLLEPDIAIFNIFCDNDFGDIIRNRLFELDDNDQLIATSFERKVDEYIQNCQKEKQQFQCLLAEETIGLINRVFGEKENPNKKEDWIKKLITLCENEYAIYENKQAKHYTHFLDHFDIDLAVNPDAPSAIAKTKLMAAVLDSINRVGQANGVKVVIQLLPSVIDLTDNHIIGYADLEAAYPNYRRKRLTNIVEEFCKNQKISCLNLYDPFSQQGAAECYFRQDDHWNDFGQAVAARAMKEFLLNQGWE